jgi:hypothetical protein
MTVRPNTFYEVVFGINCMLQGTKTEIKFLLDQEVPESD